MLIFVLLFAICTSNLLISGASIDSHSIFNSLQREIESGRVPFHLDPTEIDLLPASNLQAINRDPEYMIYNLTFVSTETGKEESIVWRQVRLGAYYFSYNKLPLKPFWHTYMILADDAFYNNYPGSGSRGWDLSKFDDGTFYLRLESDTLPKTDVSPRDRQRFPQLRFEDLCYTRRSDEDIRQHAVKFRGKYSILGRNCLDYTYYLVKYVCGKDIAVQAMEKYRLLLNAVYKPLRRLKESHLLPEFKEREWYFIEHPKNETLREIRRQHYQKVFDPIYTYTHEPSTNKNPKWWQIWKWQLWQKLLNNLKDKQQ